MFVALLVAFPLGIISAIYRNSWIDNVARFFALIGVSMPSFWFGPLLIIAFAINLPWFPVSGRQEGLKSIVLPSRSEEHTSELQSQSNLVCRLLLEKKKTI